jgi:non-heme chloroperoxidase
MRCRTGADHTTPDEAARWDFVRLGSGLSVHLARQGDTDGTPLVFLPGYADSSFSYSRVLALLPARYRSFAIDPRGHGDSDRPACCYAVDDFVSDTVAFLDTVGVERSVIAAHSGSCFVARRLAIKHPERVAALVLSGSPAGSLAPRVAEALTDFVSGLTDPVPADLIRDFQASGAYGPLPDRFLERLVIESGKLPARVWRDAARGLVAFDDTADLARIHAPVLFVWGDHDGLLSVAEQRRMAASIAGARSLIYPETGHSPHWERPERFVADLDAFVGSM